MTQRDIRIRPLSEGIGLGALKTPSPKIQLTDIDTSVMRQAHAAYAPHSVETEIRQRLATKWYVHSVRFLASTGIDIFVGVISAFMIAWVSVLAWTAGESGQMDVLASLAIVVDFLTAQSVFTVAAEIIFIAFSLRIVRYFVGRFA